MTVQSQKNAIRIITVVVALIVVAIFFMNGAEKEDAWLYLVAIFTVLSIPVITYPKKNQE